MSISWSATESTIHSRRYTSWIFQVRKRLLRDTDFDISWTRQISCFRSSLLLCVYSRTKRVRQRRWISNDVRLMKWLRHCRIEINSSHNRIDFVIADETFFVMITKWTHDLSDNLLRNDQRRFVIHHSDLSVNNIFVDEEFNITCIIDWAFCSTVSLFILLTAPDLSQSRHELNESLLSMFEKEFRHALKENVQRKDINAENRLCWMLSHSRSMWLFSRILTFDSTTDYYLFKALWESIENYDQEMTEFFRSMQSSKKYSSLHIELKKDDQTMLQVTELKRKYFDKDVWRLTILRKLTLVFKWSSRYHEPCTYEIRSNDNVFVANKKLWAWIDKCLEFKPHSLCVCWNN